MYLLFLGPSGDIALGIKETYIHSKLSVFKSRTKVIIFPFKSNENQVPLIFSLSSYMFVASWGPSKVTASPLEVGAQSTWSCCYT